LDWSGNLAARLRPIDDNRGRAQAKEGVIAAVYLDCGGLRCVVFEASPLKDVTADQFTVLDDRLKATSIL
jgi:hypothetical protein